jgi:hypothetical protein
MINEHALAHVHLSLSILNTQYSILNTQYSILYKLQYYGLNENFIALYHRIELESLLCLKITLSKPFSVALLARLYLPLWDNL